MLCGRELGDNLVVQRLEDALQDVLEPRFFGDGSSEGDASEFGYFFHLGEEWPRGQLNSLMMCNDLLTTPGDWLRVFQNGNVSLLINNSVFLWRPSPLSLSLSRIPAHFS